ncbi:hypothetical protein BGZ46_006922 [Entomortierella lignicola]|nr:hypothetical protein BGZ46_006922 [Entomortierella lignicola]
MKFAKYLQEEAIPEWRKAYINYKQGKKYLKAIEHTLNQLEAEALMANHHIPAHLLDTTNLNEMAIPSSQFPQTVQYGIQQPSSSTNHSQANNTTTAGHSSSSTTTPILSKNRGHSRNYSAIINIQPPNKSAMSISASPNFYSSSAIEDDRSGMGGSTVYDSIEDPVALGRTPRIPPVKTGSTGSRFSQMALSHSSYILKSISQRFTIISPSEVPPSFRTIQVDDNSFDNVLSQLLPEERDFFQFLDAQLVMVDEFYREKELEAVTKLKVIKQQLYVANEWKKRYDEKMAKAEAERGWYVAEWSRVRKGLDCFIRADTAVFEDIRVSSSKKNLQVPTGTGYTPSSASSQITDPEQGLRYRDLRGLNSPLESSNQYAQSAPYREELVLKDVFRQDRLNHKVARTRIKAALYEFYRSLEMIKNYNVLNHTGFVKILKKFDKTAGWKASRSYLNSKLKPAYFMNSGIVEDLIKETEDVFIENFEKGHRRRGMAKLRIPDSKNQTHHFTTLRIGLYLGLAAPLLIQALQSAFSEETAIEIPYRDGLLLVYAGLFLTTLFACLFGFNMYIWAKSRINYKFIFEFDSRDNLDYQQYFELPIFFMLLLVLTLYLDFESKLTAHVATAYWPLILIVTISAILFCPLPVAHFTSRRWFISSIGRILASGYYRVEFRDFFLADEMNSLSYSIEQFEFALCAYSRQWNDLAHTCSLNQMWITPFLTGLPAWFRFLQCLRRYRDTLEWFPHLVNAGKYSASLATLFFYFSYRNSGGAHLKAVYILFSFCTSIYTFTWDVYMDWGLFRFGKHGGGANGHPFLRQELVYSNTWVYYMAIVLDLIGRFSWIARLIPMNVNVLLLSFGLAFIEVLRRWQWNFFRLENEHLNNCGQFRAIKDIPLPFHIRIEGETDDEVDEGDDEEMEEIEEEEEDVENSEPYEHHNMHDQEDGGGRHSFSQFSASSPKRHHLRSSSSHSSFARYSNGHQAHGLSTLGGDRNNNRASIHSTSTQYSERHPRFFGGGVRKSHSHNRVYNEEMEGRRGGVGAVGSSSHGSFHHFGNGRSYSFVESAVAEAGFSGAQLEAIEPEASYSQKFYDRRDFDSKIINSGDDWRWTSHMSMYRPPLHGLQTMSLGGMRGVGLEDLADEDRGGSQVIPRRKVNLGGRWRSTIFGSPKHSDDEDTK